MKLLIQYGGNPNATDTEKWTPLVRKIDQNSNQCGMIILEHHMLTR